MHPFISLNPSGLAKVLWQDLALRDFGFDGRKKENCSAKVVYYRLFCNQRKCVLAIGPEKLENTMENTIKSIASEGNCRVITLETNVPSVLPSNNNKKNEKPPPSWLNLFGVLQKLVRLA